ncbi:hypothetical protein GDO81_013516 [Engystomops pustulosus]|uniref:Zinc finger CCCH-type with G patch domain-containing protein n=1 Tax=Engystomops pustulosus TaxID=76066 RepID=A0AAV7B4J2_ENGPU|nr:hypothetical protein GDO81_013516 [Engystomops pustulosus]
MDEERLISALQTYRAQLEQVRFSLHGDVDPLQKADLIQLEGDLQQLIELTESSLLSVQKSNLLTALSEPSSSTSQNDDYEAFKKAIEEVSNGGSPQEKIDTINEEEDHTDEGEEEDDDDEEEISGMKIKAPYYSTWGTLEYHNAMIVGSEQMEDGDAGVRVLYLYPTHKAMKPCPYFLDGKCRFNENCRFSHGQVVSVSELQVFEEPDLSNLRIDTPCLARHEDGIWYPARITDIDSNFYTVKFDSLLLKDSVLEADAIIPPLRECDSSSSDDEDLERDVDSGYARVLMDSGEVRVTPCSSEFAGWEAHTRGIGSKLMARMGYQLGKGLGKNSEGRVEPVQAVILPKGKSLDQCLELQQRKNKRGKPMPKAKKKHQPSKAGQGGSANRNIFDFLNEKLENKPLRQTAETRIERKGKEVYNASKSSKRALNIAIAQMTEKIQQKQREIGRMAEALARNLGDNAMTVQLESRLSNARSELADLQQQERSLQKEQKKADTHKKMTEF